MGPSTIYSVQIMALAKGSVIILFTSKLIYSTVYPQAQPFSINYVVNVNFVIDVAFIKCLKVVPSAYYLLYPES